MPRLRVLHVVPNLFGSGQGQIIGGGERYAYELARSMSQQVPTTLLSFGPNPFREKRESLQVEVIGPAWAVRGQVTNPIHYRLIPHLAKADVIHCHQQHILASSISALLGRTAGKKVFVTDLGGGGWDISGYISTDKWYHGHLHISEYSRKQFGQADWARAHVIYGGVDATKFVPDSTQVGNYVLYVGRLMPHKGVDYLVRAVGTDIPLRLLGRPYHADYLQLLKSLANSSNVTFQTGAEDSELIQAYQGALCIVLPSVYTTCYGDYSPVPELLGQTLMEGMACGIPAICADVASMPEVVEHGVSGFVVPPNHPEALREKIRWLQEHPLERKQMGQAARKRILEQFSWKTVVDRCLKIYQIA